jgi:hypothetical protein
MKDLMVSCSHTVIVGCAPEFARARCVERYVQRLMQDLKAKHHRECISISLGLSTLC